MQDPSLNIEVLSTLHQKLYSLLKSNEKSMLYIAPVVDDQSSTKRSASIEPETVPDTNYPRSFQSEPNTPRQGRYFKGS